MRWNNLKLRHRLMLVFASFCFLVTALFSLYALVFAYTVEDEFFEAMLQQEAQRQQLAYAKTGTWAISTDQSLSVATSSKGLPAEILDRFLLDPKRREFAGLAGRHFHILPLSTDPTQSADPGQNADPAQNADLKGAWLVAEVSEKLVFRRMRASVFEILVGSTLAVLALALLLAWWLANSTAGPLSKLADIMANLQPDQLPSRLVPDGRLDEIGILTCGLNDLIARIQQFIEREQEFTRDASHELRTPLSVIRCAAEQICEMPNLPVAASAQLKLIQSSALQLHQTVMTLLSLARESTQPIAQPVLVLPLIEQVIVEQSPWLDRKSMHIELEVAPQFALTLPGNVLHIVLANLLGNAFQHGALNSTVRIFVEQGRLCIYNAHSPSDEGSAGFGFGLSIVRRLAKRFAIDFRIAHSLDQTQASIAVQEKHLS